MSKNVTLKLSKNEPVDKVVEEITRIVMHKPVEFINYDLLSEVFMKMFKNNLDWGSMCVPLSLSAVYYLGYIHGVQKEKEKKKKLIN